MRESQESQIIVSIQGDSGQVQARREIQGANSGDKENKLPLKQERKDNTKVRLESELEVTTNKPTTKGSKNQIRK